MDKRLFSINEANELLPFLINELEQLKLLKEQFETACTNLKQLKQLSIFNGNQLQSDPFFKMECEIDFLHIQIGLHIDNIQNTGAQLKDIEIGLVDFPAEINGKNVLLCWKIGEPSVSFFHGEDDGFLGRQPLSS